MKKYLFSSLALAAAVFTTSARAETINCIEITAIPMVITVQGVYCLKGNLATSLTVGNMIEIQTNNVTIDFNGFKLGGLAGGAGTFANGIFAQNRKNITLRNGAIRGFRQGILLQTFGGGTASGHLIEDMLLDGNREVGIHVFGNGMTFRRNRIVNTGPSNNSTSASGIVLTSANNSVVADNLISGTSGPNASTGVLLAGALVVEISGNTILDTGVTGVKRGIRISGGADITVIGNRVINAAGTGTAGIINTNTATGLNCIGNTVAGFTTALSGCDFMIGNNTPP